MAQNPNELFDVVDAQDRVIGQATRAEVHARGLWHRAVHVWVFDRAGRIFLQQRSLKKDMSPGLWDASSTGHLDAGEDYDAAAVRELGEELGLRVAAPPARWLRVGASAETGWEFGWVYRLGHAGPFVLHPEEIQGGAWVTPEELRARLAERPEQFTPAFRVVAPRALAERGRGEGGEG